MALEQQPGPAAPREAARPLAWPRRAGGGAGRQSGRRRVRAAGPGRGGAPRALPRHYFLLEVVAPESAIQDSDAPANWLTDLQATRALGNAWLARGETALLRVPSAAGGLQYLLNAEHPQLAQCQIVSALAYPYLPHLTGLDSAVLDGAGWLVTARPGE